MIMVNQKIIVTCSARVDDDVMKMDGWSEQNEWLVLPSELLMIHSIWEYITCKLQR
jgi:hypothetical protein